MNTHTSITENARIKSNRKLSTWWRRYRIVRDRYLGYEAQVWRVWWPFWVEIGFANTSASVEAARQVCEHHAQHVVMNV